MLLLGIILLLVRHYGIMLTVVIKGSSTIKWIVKNDDEVNQVILTHAYYVLDASVRLFSPQKYIKQLENASLLLRPKVTYLHLRIKVALHFLN